MFIKIALQSKSGSGAKADSDASSERTQNPAPLMIQECMPLTAYGDYAGSLLARRTGIYPQPVSGYIRLEGGHRPLKLSPYTKCWILLKHNPDSLILSAAGGKGDIRVKSGDRIVYGGAPSLCGPSPSLLSEEAGFSWFPDAEEENLTTLSARSKKGA